MKTIYYITRTIPGGGTGGALIRQGSVKFLRDAGYKVIIVALSNVDKENDDCILVKGVTTRLLTRVNLILYNLRVLDDYLQPWSEKAFRTLKNRIRKDDIVLATSGGELGTLMLAPKLKEAIGCRTVYNLHDPIDFTTIEGEFSFLSSVKMRGRDKAEYRVFRSADAIVTSSRYYADALKKKYPDLASVFSCHHFGYIEQFEGIQSAREKVEGINVVYGGNMGPLQGPEILMKLAAFFPKVTFTFVGDLFCNENNKPQNVVIKPKMPYKDYITYLSQNADIGFFSLRGNVSKLCVPSKLYEYINVGIPILAAIDGDARSIVNDNGFGVATDYDVDCLKSGLEQLLLPGALESAKMSVSRQRDKWFMGHTINELIQSFDGDDNR